MNNLPLVVFIGLFSFGVNADVGLLEERVEKRINSDAYFLCGNELPENISLTLKWKSEDVVLVTMDIISPDMPADVSVTNVDANRYRVDNETGALHISSLSINDSGHYQCHLAVSTEQPSIISKYNLKVRENPKPPEMQQATAVNATAINVSWIHTTDLLFEVTGYDVLVANSIGSDKKETHVPVNTTYTVFTSLKPYTRYFVTASACAGDVCSVPSSHQSVWTKEDAPSKPDLLPVNNRSSTHIHINWRDPERPNGELRGYVIFWQESGHNYWNMYNQTNQYRNSYTITSLKPWTKYRIYIVAYNNAGSSPESDTINTYTERIAPSAPRNVSVPDVNTTAIIVTWVQPEMITGEIDSYRLRYRVWGRSDSVSTYLTIHNDIAKNYMYQRRVVTNLEPGTTYIVEVQATTVKYFPPRSPLISPFSEEVRTQTAAVKEEPEKSSGNDKILGAIIGLAVTGAILVVLIIGFLFMKKYMMKNRAGRYWEVNQCNHDGIGLNDIYGESVPIREDITVEKFASHVTKNHADGDLIFSQEFDDINQTSRTDLGVKHSLDPDNRNKNRYVNIMAYDHSRVVLRTLSGATGDSSYINANYIEGYQKPRSYVACQGPLTQTAGDFWRMVWEQNTAVIVMITNLTERGRRKCDQYWPTEGDSVFGLMNVKLLSESVTAHYTLRKFMLKYMKDARISVRKRGNAERVIHQFHFTEWPDHGVPDFTLPVLQYIKRSIAAIPEGSGPPVVHCSAGVGRTGTYIVIDSMMKQIADRNSINVYSFLTHIRQQRNYMVQTEEQYVFIHDVLQEHIQSGNTEVQGSNLTQYILDLKNVHDRKVSDLEKQYELVVAYTPKDFEHIAANMDVNKPKNRSKKILPVEISRVKLPMNPGILGSDYINASYLQGYFKKEEYMVTQHPLPDTLGDFWRMVWDQNTMTIVLLSQVDSTDYVAFWPEKDETVQYANFTMTFINESQQGQYVYRDFLLQSTQDDYECTTRLISPQEAWPDRCAPLSTAFDLIHTVKRWHCQHEVEGPIVVVDKFGGKEAATFCILSTLQDQLEQDNSVDVYLNAKLYHLKRPGIFPSEDSYLFIYRAMEALVAEDNAPSADKDSGISNCNNYRGSLPPGVLPDLPPPAVIRSSSRNSAIRNDSPVNRTCTL